MGWWSNLDNEQEIIQGDSVYDILGKAFDDITTEYVRDWSRKPTLEELVMAIEVVLGSTFEKFVQDGDAVELTKLIAKTKKRRRSQSYRVGDYFMIPLLDGRYAFGRILSDIRQDKMGMLVGIYSQVSEHVIHPHGLTDRSLMFPPFFCSDQGWISWKWKILSNEPISVNESEMPRFKLGTEFTGWQIMDGHQIYDATESDVVNLEYATLWTLGSVEMRIEEYLNQETEH